MQDASDGPDPSAAASTPSPSAGADGAAAPPAGDGPPGQGAPGGAATGPGASAGPQLGNLPEKPIAALYNAMSGAWGDPFTAISRGLSLKQYQGGDTVLPMTVDNLMALPQGVGVLVMFAHGVFAKDGLFCIATSHVANPADDARFAADLNAPAGQMAPLVTFDVSIAPTAPAEGPVTTTNYCITAAFVAKYWTAKFCQDSLALMCVCSVLDKTVGTAVQLVEVLHSSAGVGYLLGWDGVAVTTDMSSAAIFLVDRLLGANDSAAKPEDPPQRPFDIGAVLDDIGHYTNVTGGPLNTSQGSLPGVTLAQANLVASPDPENSTKFGILAPSIVNLEMMAVETKLAIAGWFGDDPGPDRGVVKINDTPIAYDSWAPHQIVCPLLVGDESGPVVGQAAGTVVVEVDGRPSNAVPLTEWRGKLIFTVNGAGTQKLVCTWTYHLKADVHHFRIKPGSDASCFLDAPVGVFTLRDSSLTYTASGTEILPGSPPQHVSWAGSGTLKPATDMSNPKETYVFAGRIVRPAPPPLDGSYMLLGVVGGDGATWTYNVDSDGSVSPTPAFADWSDLYSRSPGPPFEGLMLKLPLDDQMGIAAAIYPFTVGEHACVLSLQPEPTNYPPDPTKGEDQSAIPSGFP